MVPCIDDSIPVYVRNIFNPSFEGTVVQGRSPTLKETGNVGKSVNWRSKKVCSQETVVETSKSSARSYHRFSRVLFRSRVSRLSIRLH
jgi:aspartokinase